MANDHKTKVEQDASRIVTYLLEHRAEFEQDGVDESSIPAAVSLSEDEAREAVDRLENREDVVRWPQALTTPPKFMIKPGRGWRLILEKSSEHAHGGANQ
ncbi:MAG TPA: hypothetical protein VJQ56_13525 [Blastocatellia bacterium]|nr:hypothetical protein [Blastocatellia bacterium]